MKRYAGAVLLALVLVFIAAGGWWFERSVSGQTVDPKHIADQFFPESIVNEDSVARRSCLQVYDTLPDGNPRTIMAGYSDGFQGVIRVVRAQSGGSYSVVFEPTNLNLWGFNCGVELVDADGDGIKEVKFSFPGGARGNTQDWVFRWDGIQLLNLSPVSQDENGQLSTQLVNSLFLDLHHDGTLQILNPPAFLGLGSDTELPEVIYRLTPTGYELDKVALFASSFTRDKGEPITLTRHFPLLNDSTGPYVLRLANGGSGGQHRVSSARIVLNGAEVLSPQNFSQQVEFLEIPVELVANNKLEVTLAGQPLGFVTITIEDTSAPQGSSQ